MKLMMVRTYMVAPSMASSSWATAALLLLFSLPLSTAADPSPSPSLDTFIVQTHNSSTPPHFPTHHDWHASILSSIITAAPPRRILYTYRSALHGFAARLSPQEVELLTTHPDVLTLYPDRLNRISTTRTPSFLGLTTSNGGLLSDAKAGDGIIVGLIDSGIWPESKSFDDAGLDPPRPEWKGQCQNGTRFDPSLCNNKLIGARFFPAAFEAKGVDLDKDEYRSPRDKIGHGTHTASTAAGSPVGGANMLGLAAGTARGVAPKAKLAMYKACWMGGCYDSDLLAAMDSAIEDGVDVISISVSQSTDYPYHRSALATGAYEAAKCGVFVALAAGNQGPGSFSVANTAPWMTTVGAATIDRSFSAQAKLGNGEVIHGQSLYSKEVNGNEKYPLIYIPFCDSDSLVADKVKGKVVVCDAFSSIAVENGLYAQQGGAAGMISYNDEYVGDGKLSSPFTLPALQIGYKDGMKVLSYINGTNNPTASMRTGVSMTIVGKEIRAPMVAFYSSRGPNYIVAEIIKPDIIAPGTDVLAAWPSELPPAETPMDTRKTDFNIISGTSMACPHVAGVAALLKKAHPDWSPAMIRSAMMTTAAATDNQGRAIVSEETMEETDVFTMGSGHVAPQKANDPGLVYDAGATDYIQLLCSLNYTQDQIKAVVKETVNCPAGGEGPAGLNYPSIAVVFVNDTRVVQVSRTVTMVAPGPETYNVRVSSSAMADKLKVSVSPQTLSFMNVKERQTFHVKFESKYVHGNKSGKTNFEESGSGFIVWESDKHRVRSPFAVTWKWFD